MLSQVGVPELLIVLVIVLLVFGTKRLPALGRQLGGGLREFKDAITGDKHAADGDEEPHERPALPAASVPADPPAEQAAAEAASERRG
jgi:sec-independent protein translocase protein TatA